MSDIIYNIEKFVPDIPKIKFGGKEYEIKRIKVFQEFELLKTNFKEKIEKDPLASYKYLFENFCPGLEEHLEKMTVQEVEVIAEIIFRSIFPKKKKTGESGKSDREVSKIEAGYLIAKFLDYYPSYTVDAVLNMDYEVFDYMLEMGEVVEAEKNLVQLNIYENKLLLKNKKTANKWDAIYKKFQKIVAKGVEITEKITYDAKGIEEMKRMFGGGK